MAATLGPTIGGLLVTVSWRGIFLINLPLGIIIAVAAVRILAESRDPDRAQRPDLLGSLLLIVAVGALALGIVEGGEWGWTSAGVIGSEAVAILAAVALRGPLDDPPGARARAGPAEGAGRAGGQRRGLPLLDGLLLAAGPRRSS